MSTHESRTGTPARQPISLSLQDGQECPSSSRLLPALIAAVLLLGGGVVQGTLTHRWQTSARSNGPETRLANIPLQIGEWDGQDNTLSDQERTAAGVTHYLLRNYTNRATGEVVSVTLMAGPTGPIAVHPPTACYTGLGYKQVGTTRAHRCLTSTAGEKSPSHLFQTAHFVSPKLANAYEPRIYWAWTTDGVWQTPESPRLTFAGAPLLFKLYVAHQSDTAPKPRESTSSERFLEQLLPAIAAQVFAQQSAPKL